MIVSFLTPPALPSLDGPSTDPLAALREADGPTEEIPVAPRPITHVVVAAKTDTHFGAAATVGEIIDRANAIRANGRATALRWVRNSDRLIVGIELATYEARA